MNYISLDNLTRYHSKFKDYADAKYTLARDYGWKQTEKAGAVTCWPVGESRMKPVVEFKFKETLPVSDKSEQNPSTIEGVDSVNFTRCGKNLLAPYSSSSTKYYITLTPSSDGSHTVNGTATGNASFNFRGIRLIDGDYYLSGCPTGGATNTYFMGFAGGIRDIGEGVIYTNSGRNNKSCWIGVASGTTVSNIVFKPQLELGSVRTEFEIYNGNDYSISLNSIYYGGILDVSTGTLTVTHRMIEPDSLTIDISNYPAYLPLECTDTFGRTITSTGNILALTGSTGGKIVYKLANPYTVQIDPVTITALPQIDKYTPRINTLYTDAENITVGYQKSPIRDEYEKVQAIIANGGTI